MTLQEHIITIITTLWVGLLAKCQHPNRFGDHRDCDSGCLMFLTYHVTSRDHVLRGLCDFAGGSPSQSSASGITTCLFVT